MSQFERLFFLMKKPWFAVVYVLLLIVSYYFVDKSLALYFHGLDSRKIWYVLNWITMLGKSTLSLVIFLFLACFARWVLKNPVLETRAWFVWACILIPNLLGKVLKITLGRARPDLLFSQDLYGFYWFKFTDAYWSCPSGHALTATGLAFGLSIIYPRLFYLFFLFALSIVATRVILYHHYLSDVMIGFYLATILAGLFMQWTKRSLFFNKVYAN